MKTLLSIVLSLITYNISIAQYAPQVGIDGHEGIYKDSSIFINWATGCTLERGLQDIANPNSGLTTIGDINSPLGNIDGSVVSLGDGGQATLTFEYPIYNDKGPDFAVFENAFIQSSGSEMALLELAFVEVSSDGSNFIRFPAVSVISDSLQIGGFSFSNARQINNLAGKYIANYGTAFDLEELKFEEGLDVNHITHIRIIDAVGSIDPAYASYDSQGNIINDPFPTPFGSSGFDLSGVGVIHQKVVTSIKSRFNTVVFYPNPANDFIQLNLSDNEPYTVDFYTIFGKNVLSINVQNEQQIDISKLNGGSYIGLVKNSKETSTFKMIKQ